jgi:hypothetical protein
MKVPCRWISLAGREGPGFIDFSGYDFGEVLRAKNRQRPVLQFSKQGNPFLTSEFFLVKKSSN